MLYLLDASALITAHNTYYALHRVPEFWAWLRHHGEAGRIKLPREIYSEVEDGNDTLSVWMGEAASKSVLLLDEDQDADLLRGVLAQYGDDLSDSDLITIGNDPFLVAAALASNQEKRCVVTAEVSKPSRTGARRHIPDVCGDCGVEWMTPVALLNSLDFKTSWK